MMEAGATLRGGSTWAAGLWSGTDPGVCSSLSPSHLFIWQTHNALFIICCLLKVFTCELSEEELQLHFTYEEKCPGSYSECHPPCSGVALQLLDALIRHLGDPFSEWVSLRDLWSLTGPEKKVEGQSLIG